MEVTITKEILDESLNRCRLNRRRCKNCVVASAAQKATGNPKLGFDGYRLGFYLTDSEGSYQAFPLGGSAEADRPVMPDARSIAEDFDDNYYDEAALQILVGRKFRLSAEWAMI
jgi:hypothetical protein